MRSPNAPAGSILYEETVQPASQPFLVDQASFDERSHDEEIVDVKLISVTDEKLESATTELTPQTASQPAPQAEPPAVAEPQRLDSSGWRAARSRPTLAK
jgi:hypothetical protein